MGSWAPGALGALGALGLLVLLVLLGLLGSWCSWCVCALGALGALGARCAVSCSSRVNELVARNPGKKGHVWNGMCYEWGQRTHAWHENQNADKIMQGTPNRAR